VINACHRRYPVADGGRVCAGGRYGGSTSARSRRLRFDIFRSVQVSQMLVDRRSGAAVKLGSNPAGASLGFLSADFNCESVKG